MGANGTRFPFNTLPWSLTMKTETRPSGACPTFFRAACRKASEGGNGNGYDWAGYTLAGALANLIEYQGLDEADAKAEKLQEFAALFHHPGQLVRSVNVFLTSPDAPAALAWLARELPRCMALVPADRRDNFLRGVFRYVVEEENDITTW